MWVKIKDELVNLSNVLKCSRHEWHSITYGSLSKELDCFGINFKCTEERIFNVQCDSREDSVKIFEELIKLLNPINVK